MRTILQKLAREILGESSHDLECRVTWQPPRRVYPLAEAARLLDIQKEAVTRWFLAGRIPGAVAGFGDVDAYFVCADFVERFQQPASRTEVPS